VINGAALLLITVTSLLNGLASDGLALWRQVLFVVVALASYLHGRWLPVRYGGWLLLAVTAAAGAGLALRDPAEAFGAVLSTGLFVALPWLAGRFRRQQAELVIAGRQRVAQLEREQEFIAEQARLRERTRIAADMHDSVGHELALIALRAGALELSRSLSEPDRDAAAQLRASAVTATDRLRVSIGMLRDPSVPAPVDPPNETVESLVTRARDAGMSVSLRRGGIDGPLPPPVDRALHRVVQEALTNAARYAPGATVSVCLDGSPGSVTASVFNGPATTDVAVTGGGRGLHGLRERVRLLDGTLRAGPRDDGFEVVATVPLRAGKGTR
jgi:signal transduction histidine kinase